MTHFWIVCGITMISVIACMVINNAQYHALKNLIPFLSETVKANLILNGEPGKARKISLDEVPQMIAWLNECKNYGWINLFGFSATLALIVSGGMYHKLSILTIGLSALFFVANIIFLLKAFDRLNKAIEKNNSYVLLMKTFEAIQTKGTI